MSKIFGAQAKVFMKYEDNLEGLSKVLSKGLLLSNFTVKFREEPPYELTGSCEALGFEIWLNEASIIPGYGYVIEMQTELSSDELSLGQMHDLSLWLARFSSKMCDINTCVLDSSANLLFFNVE